MLTFVKMSIVLIDINKANTSSSIALDKRSISNQLPVCLLLLLLLRYFFGGGCCIIIRGTIVCQLLSAISETDGEMPTVVIT